MTEGLDRPDVQSPGPNAGIPCHRHLMGAMLLDVSQMRGAVDHVDRTLDPSAVAGSDDLFRVVAPVRLTFDIEKDGAKFRLVGGTGSELELQCSRCLETYRFPIEAAFDLRYVPQSANTGEGEREVEEDDLDTAFYRDGLIDLGQLVREQFYLALPMKPLCAEACRGLCPACGANLNTAPCSCQAGWQDARLGGLRSPAGDKSREET